MSEGKILPPAQYEIRVTGYLNPEREKWFEGMTLTARSTPSGDAITILSGSVGDRAALFGILSRIRDLGLTLISVNSTWPEMPDTIRDDFQQKEGE